MSQVLLTGATGLVGGHLLHLLQSEPGINAITAPTRRPLAVAEGVFNPHDPQLTDALAQVVDPVDIVFCCLGTTRREAGSKEAFVHADYTLVGRYGAGREASRSATYAGGQRDGR